MLQLPLPPLPLPPPNYEAPLLRNPVWELQRYGFNSMSVKIDAKLTRHDAFRLIGELERMAASL